ncbi:hypothetical protein [Leuconostoc mesenteroides]
MYLFTVLMTCVSIFFATTALFVGFKTSHPVTKYVARFIGFSLLVLVIYLLLLLTDKV